MKPRIIASVEARMTSSRLPGKVLKPILGRPSLSLLIERLRQAKSLSAIMVATTVNGTDDPIVELCREEEVLCFRGSEEDVLGRVVQANEWAQSDIIVEITGDCTLIDPEMIDETVEEFLKGGYDYVSTNLVRTYPRGLVVQVFWLKVLQEADRATTDPQDREHVSLYIYSHPEKYKLKNLEAPQELTRPDLAFVLDTVEDYELITKIYEELYPANPRFRVRDILDLFKRKPELAEINKHVPRKKPSRPIPGFKNV